jgi:hypothetical protein
MLNSGRKDDRIARVHQSHAASLLLARVAEREGPPRIFTKSHSRTAIAVAMGDDHNLLLGIDIEWMAPERPVKSIARSFLGDAAAGITVADFYRFWTFHEAFFKAFQRAPEPALALELIAQEPKDGVQPLRDGTNILQRRVAESFQLSLVWSGADCIPHDMGDVVDSEVFKKYG